MARGPSGFIDVLIVGDDTAVQAALLKMEIALSPPGLGIFLSGMVEPYLRERARERFASEGDDASGKWAPLTPYTQGIRASKGYGAAHPINRRTGELENYITNTPATITTGGDISKLKYPGKSASGKLRKKVQTAQVGISGRPYTPPRPVLGMNATDLEAVLLGLAIHIESYF